ncbi:DUF6402 family protein [Pseudomonas fulva]|uniref:DUF6402 family protein n=1 Tax=Pseudomonas TaxID=286 RepID=UPI0007201172|nr:MULTISPECIES: DUF6402 family protein [Pseudomonas]MBH3361517.1 hypothetical protein [Pseudomonas sp. URMO17WK12:I11]MDH0620330.1 DUF6402 family protein [Pseudomonas fulva]CRN07747.1 hypothetical protein PYEL_35930 [Pseudomonas sp. URMO17WK12:I11]
MSTAPTSVTAALTPSAKSEGSETQAKDFRLSDIPGVMGTLTWVQAQRIMQRWFDGQPYVLEAGVKSGNVAASTLSKEKVMEDLPFEWLNTGSTRIKPIIEDLEKQFRYVRDYNQTVGRLHSSLSELSPGLMELLRKLRKLGAIDLDKLTLRNGYYDLSDQSAITLDESTQFNFKRIGVSLWEQATDKLDDVYGALGGFAIKLAATRMATVVEEGRPSKICIDEIGMYVRDTYDFINTGSDQFLGYWGEQGVLDPGAIDYMLGGAYVDKDGKRYFRVTNGSFNQYRDAHKMGGDFLIFSTVHKVPVDIEITIGKVDLQEFKGRASGRG